MVATRASSIQKPVTTRRYVPRGTHASSHRDSSSSPSSSGRERRRRGKNKMQQRIIALEERITTLLEIIAQLTTRTAGDMVSSPVVFDLFSRDGDFAEVAVQTDISTDWSKPDVFVQLPLSLSDDPGCNADHQRLNSGDAAAGTYNITPISSSQSLAYSLGPTAHEVPCDESQVPSTTCVSLYAAEPQLVVCSYDGVRQAHEDDNSVHRTIDVPVTCDQSQFGAAHCLPVHAARHVHQEVLSQNLAKPPSPRQALEVSNSKHRGTEGDPATQFSRQALEVGNSKHRDDSVQPCKQHSAQILEPLDAAADYKSRNEADSQDAALHDNLDDRKLSKFHIITSSDAALHANQDDRKLSKFHIITSSPLQSCSPGDDYEKLAAATLFLGPSALQHLHQKVISQNLVKPPSPRQELEVGNSKHRSTEGDPATPCSRQALEVGHSKHRDDSVRQRKQRSAQILEPLTEDNEEPAAATLSLGPSALQLRLDSKPALPIHPTSTIPESKRVRASDVQLGADGASSDAFWSSGNALDFKSAVAPIVATYCNRRKPTNNQARKAAMAVIRVAKQFDIPQAECCAYMKEHSLALWCTTSDLWDI